ncbi:DNA/RNA non-specific endonuclease [Streptomyces sp. NPDC057638]|uniref:DNA/RNA non-specific endonuclease n=1 Tax=Streptomyces sp. NPDC057638 TaxID=3346190 RepID=UPI00367640BA
MSRKKRAVATSHPPARTEAAAAQDAARPPKDDEEAQGKSANAEKMHEAKPKAFDREAFIRAVEQAIAAKAPKNLDEADTFAESGKADEVRAEVQGTVGEGRTESAEQIATTTAAPPDTAAAVTKEVVPLTPDRPPAAPGTPDPANAVPDRLPPAATDMSAGPKSVDRRMAEASVTEPQLRRSNEPSFRQALGEKKAAERHSAAAPPRLRKHEAGELSTATGEARRTGTTAMGAMGAQRALTGQRVDSGKTGAKSRDEEKRTEVTAILQRVFDAMKKDVEAILDGLDKLVDEQFTRGEKAARDAFTSEHEREMDAYKDRRYSGAFGWARWGKDKLLGLPAEAERIFDRAREGYLRRMRLVIADVATTVGTELDRAKQRIAQGRTELRAAVGKLPAGLKAIGQEAMAEFDGKFEELTQSVDDKATTLVDTLATKYTEALKSVDDEIATAKEKNKGLVDKAVEAVASVINTILELKDMLLAVLAKAASAVMLILKDPVGFLRNLVTGVGAGLRQFLRNIGRHLQQGIMSWLLGRAAEAGLQLPAKFDTRGVLTMLAGLLGLTWPAIRARITRKVPEEAVAAAETAVPLVAEVRKRGVAGMWGELKSRVGDLRRDLVAKVIAYVTPAIVTAGITWILSLLNPASAFVRAVKLLIDIVTFVVTQARQIIDFVNSVLDAVIAIAKGATGGVAARVESALARSIPVLLGFLAALLGVGGIAARVRQIVQAMARPVNMAIDQVIDTIAALAKRAWARIRATRTRPRTKPTPRKPGPATPRPRPTAGRPRRRGDDRRPGRKRDTRRGKRADARQRRKDRARQRRDQRRTDRAAAALRDATALVTRDATIEGIEKALPPIRRRHKVRLLKLVIDRREPERTVIHFRAINSPAQTSAPQSVPDDSVAKKIKAAMPEHARNYAEVVHTFWWNIYVSSTRRGIEDNAKTLWKKTVLTGTKSNAFKVAKSPEFQTPLREYFKENPRRRATTGEFYNFVFVQRAETSKKDFLEALGRPVPEKLKTSGLAAINTSPPIEEKHRNRLRKALEGMTSASYDVTLKPYGRLEVPKLEAPPHSDFFPLSIHTVNAAHERVTTYTTRAGKSFKVVEKDPQRSKSLQVIGADLRLKPRGEARGIHQDSPGMVTNLNLNRAHAIADIFGGSGYRESLNMVTTSDTYNQSDMKQAETTIQNDLINFATAKGHDAADVSLHLTVTIHFGELLADVLTSKIEHQPWWYQEGASPEDMEKAKKKLAEIVKKMMHPPVRRVIGVDYVWKLSLPSGAQKPGETTIGGDEWLFEKREASSGES